MFVTDVQPVSTVPSLMVHTQSNEFTVLLVNVTVKGAQPSVTLGEKAAVRFVPRQMFIGGT